MEKQEIINKATNIVIILDLIAIVIDIIEKQWLLAACLLIMTVSLSLINKNARKIDYTAKKIKLHLDIESLANQFKRVMDNEEARSVLTDEDIKVCEESIENAKKNIKDLEQ